MHTTVCVFTSYENQLERLKNRGHGSEQYFKELLSKQMPSNEKCERSDYLIETRTFTSVEKRVKEILKEIKTQHHA
jgi:dephospho-CoA kinase